MQISAESKCLWLWLSLICGPGSADAERLLDHFEGSVSEIYEADEEAYRAVPQLTPETVFRLSNKSLEAAKEIEAYCCREGVGILTLDSPFYPERLARVRRRPIVLYYKGVLIDLDREVCIAEVGTRTMTEYGSQAAYSVAYDMARAGAVVVSGMAKGVDGMAHRGALDAGGYTVAVLGCGIDRAYPTENLELMNQIIKNGVVMTEYKPFSPPNGWHFPLRNRIISGLSQGTVVIEAPRKSGALITAQTALEQGRDVFAIPGKVGELGSTGTNELIRDGARIVTCAADVLLEYQPLYPGKINLNRIPSLHSANFRSPMEARVAAPLPFSDERRNRAIEQAVLRSESAVGATETVVPSDPQPTASPKEVPKPKPKPPKRSSAPTSGREEEASTVFPPSVLRHPDLSSLTEQQRRIVEPLLSAAALNADQLAVQSGLPVAEVLVELTMLEIEGILMALPGGAYTLQSKS